MSRPGIQPARHPADPGDLGEVGQQGLAGAGVLHLDGDVAAVLPDRPVHLPDRGGRGGGVVEAPGTGGASAARARSASTLCTVAAGIGGAASCSLVRVAR